MLQSQSNHQAYTFPFLGDSSKGQVPVLPSLWPLTSGAIDPGAFPDGPEETPVSETCEQKHFVFLRLLRVSSEAVHASYGAQAKVLGSPESNTAPRIPDPRKTAVEKESLKPTTDSLWTN